MCGSSLISITVHPPIMADIISGNLATPSKPFDASDAEYFTSSWPSFVTLYDYQGVGPLTGILNPLQSVFKAVAQMAKSAYSDVSFGGLTDNKGYNMQPIRAVTIRTQAAGADVYDWTQTVSSLGWAALFGDETSPYNSGTNNTLGPSDPAYTLGNVFLLFTHLVSPTPPLFDEYQFGVGNTKYAVQVATFVQISDVYVMTLANPIVVPLNSKYWFMANYRRTGTEETRLLGAQFVLSAYASLR